MTKTKHPGMDNVQAFNTVMLPVMRAAKKAYDKNPDHPVVRKAFFELLDFYTWKPGETNE
mgnify:FL=1|tara:strand:+ start:1297 stop:1476 length:180 start_codon:yes stop_codon:yes gene_type:complete